ncbi:MAG: hypothetical protein ACREMF_06945 [Gemmatimonadales bacterium]
MSDDRFERLLHDATREYHRPPETPREEMWDRIEAERRRRRAAPRVVGLPPAWRWGLGMAAVLLLGIAIGWWMRPVPPGRAPSSVPSVATRPGNLAYSLAAVQYLSRTETLLTGFRADARTGAVDVQFGNQARELLSSTRLLLDSPAGRDPHLEPLLEDLEVVLAQIALLSAARDTEDVRLITQGIDQRSVLTRLRTAIPTGPAAAARTQGVL